MGRPRQVIRADGTKMCDYHRIWEPVESFDGRDRIYPDGPVRIYSARCRVAEQAIRDRERELDPARVSIVSRAKTLAAEISGACGGTVSYHWVLDELNWKAKIPVLRALIGPGGCCDSCGVHHDDPRAYQLDHMQPPRSTLDFAAHHARNLALLDHCNQKKGRRGVDWEWLDGQQREWMAERQWWLHAGQPGWPPASTFICELPEVVVGSVDRRGTATLFDIDDYYDPFHDDRR